MLLPIQAALSKGVWVVFIDYWQIAAISVPAVIKGFSSGMDLSGLPANQTTTTHDAFQFIGTQRFSRVPPILRLAQTGGF